MNAKGQGALEYLILIGGAVLIAAIVIVLLTGAAKTQQGTTQGALTEAEKQTSIGQITLKEIDCPIPNCVVDTAENQTNCPIDYNYANDLPLATDVKALCDKITA
ncbi:class III signal peptide-containing protein [archaeon]|nr:class III signal peptide-containing protein [archaeon]